MFCKELPIFFHNNASKFIKCNDLLNTLNVYQIPAKEHQVVHHWDADEISVSETLFSKYSKYIPQILRNYKKIKRTNYKKIKRTKIAEFNFFSALSLL